MTVLFVFALAGACYLALACISISLFARRPLDRASEFLPTFTILKPLAGLETSLYENLRSCCQQDYEAFFEVILCLHSSDDPAFVVAKRIAIEFPSRTRIAIGQNPEIHNRKIANLAKPEAEPRGEIVVIADSDIHVGRDYLASLAASFASEEVGAATCLYAGTPSTSTVSRLGAMQIEDVFIPSVLVALALGPLRFCLGATMAVRRSLLEAIGGVAALGGTIADDHKLGQLVTGKGKRIDLSRYVVRTMVPETRLGALWSRELRWARTNLALAPSGYAFSFLTYAIPLSANLSCLFAKPRAGCAASVARHRAAALAAPSDATSVRRRTRRRLPADSYSRLPQSRRLVCELLRSARAMARSDVFSDGSGLHGMRCR